MAGWWQQGCWNGTRAWIRGLAGVLLALCALFTHAAGLRELGGFDRFDHSRTGFPLTGNHLQAKCDACHPQGTFRGTPRDCATCHQSGRPGISAKPAKHIPTSAACDQCHRTAGWVPADFKHTGVAPGTCATCHNGVIARGKPRDHPTTNASCDASGCHNTRTFDR